MLRAAELVHTCTNGAAPVAGFAMLTRRVPLAQWIQSCGKADALMKVASVPSAVAE
jgi:hypothetical protein